MKDFQRSVVVDTCRSCGAAAEHTHHIRHQAEADAHGYVEGAHGGRVHKDDACNLVPLCRACHDDVHAERLRVDGYVQTSQGVQLRVQRPPVRPAPPLPPASPAPKCGGGGSNPFDIFRFQATRTKAGRTGGRRLPKTVLTE